ncbi:hypothetical protein LB557_23695 [Mesorhizobium sp. BR115XR7A]|uniref:hypothetical protein n=1 Tax=Mesorhizobium sp. BR115XR7A TaxID=2876645 RepID=UPI001CCD087E|nr:hypothetical protein [Mesorhizobium sp. BR115XR7A]MBZ9909017.1 hypothetical protein [Mesorhizobium sp. BR115XR7A]MBZ9933450.1 hypothetical protein [Mesorhizobium sp. BR1-1-5]
MHLADAAQHQAAGERLRRQIHQRGFTLLGQKLWIPKEDEICRSLYPDYLAMAKALPHRSRKAIEHRCSVLGIVHRRINVWTAKRDTLFRKMYRTSSTQELRDAFPEMTMKQIWRRGCKCKLSRPRKRPYRTTGNLLLDELREECWRQNISMPDLDEFARSGRYFRRRSWRSGLNYKHILRAINELGGTPIVQWQERTLQ